MHICMHHALHMQSHVLREAHLAGEGHRGSAPGLSPEHKCVSLVIVVQSRTLFPSAQHTLDVEPAAQAAFFTES